MIKSFFEYFEYINEKKLFIFQRKFRFDDILKLNIYPVDKLTSWMLMYDLDNYAHCMLVSEDPIKDESDLNIRVSSRDIKNKVYFNSAGKYDGYLIEDSKLTINDDIVYLFVFKKNSNSSNRARQIHGFKYEGDIRRLNGLQKLGYTDKWDAHGGLDKRFLEDRVDSGKKVEIFNGSGYKSLIKVDSINGSNEIDFESVPESYKANLSWSIKSMLDKTDIEMGDFKRISGLEVVNKNIQLIKDNTESFMFNVSFHDGSPSRNILTEYLILMPISVWKTYLPDMSDLSVYQNMFDELSTHRLIGERVPGDLKWKEFTSKYSKICKDSILKLRFKRDSKGQLRIQSSISNLSFRNIILKNNHIRIY
jgi:hypothetical protein